MTTLNPYEKGNTVVDDEFLKNAIGNISKFLITEKGFNAVETDSASVSVFPFVKSWFLENKNNGVYSINVKNCISEIGEQNNFSKEFTNIFVTLVDEYANNPDKDIDLYVNGLKLKNWTEAEFEYVDTFVEVYKASDYFWGKQDKTMNDNDYIIINDAIGALFGSAFGSIGSIIGGAALSYATNQDLKTGNY